MPIRHFRFLGFQRKKTQTDKIYMEPINMFVELVCFGNAN
jgi:hypothetical protein